MKSAAIGLAFLLMAGTVAADSISIPVRQSLRVADATATLVFTVDPLIADAAIEGSEIVITARSVGVTFLTVIRPDSTESWEIVVVQAPKSAFHHALQESRVWTSFYEVGYESSSNRAAHTFAFLGSRSVSFRLTAIDQSRDSDEDNPDVLIPDASIVIRGTKGELTLLDRQVDASPLTLDGLVVRGAHFESSRWLLSAGERDTFRYAGLFLSADGERVALVSHRHRRSNLTFTENLAWSSDGERHVRGTLLGAYEREGLASYLELGYDGEIGAALGIEYQSRKNRLWIDARHQPEGYGSTSRLAGSFADVMWNARPSERVSANVSSSYFDFRAPGLNQKNESAAADLRYALDTHWALAAGASVARYDQGKGAPIEAYRAPLTVEYERGGYGAALTARWEDSSADGESGLGGRVAVHGGRGSWRASAYVDYESATPSLRLVLDRNPLLADALAELGLFPQSIDDISRILREHPALFEAGLIDDIELDAPLDRTRAGIDLRWYLPGASRQSIGIRALLERSEFLEGNRDSALGVASYSRSLGASGYELALDYTVRAVDGARVSRSDSSYAIRLRLPVSVGGLAARRTGELEGRIVSQSADGTFAGSPGVVVILDGTTSVSTDARGEYRFTGVSRASHRVDAQLPENAYFRTPSSRSAAPGERVDFEIAYLPARLTGRVVDDQGQGVAGVGLVLRSTLGVERLETTSSGSFSWYGAPGAYETALDTLPLGYSAGDDDGTRSLRLAANDPQQLTFRLRADRSVSGRVECGEGKAIVTIVELARSIEAADDGRFAFRNLPPGTYTLRAAANGRSCSTTIAVPSGPAAIKGVLLQPAK